MQHHDSVFPSLLLCFKCLIFQVRILKKVVQNLEMEMVKDKNRYQRLISRKTEEIKRLALEVRKQYFHI